jgi:BolA protein
MPATMYDTIIKALQAELKPNHLEVIDESHQHSRRTVDNPETHFKVIVVSEVFEGLSKVRRQQLVYSVLSALFRNGLHSLTQSTYTPTEWALEPNVIKSPKCAGNG